MGFHLGLAAFEGLVLLLLILWLILPWLFLIAFWRMGTGLKAIASALDNDSGEPSVAESHASLAVVHHDQALALTRIANAMSHRSSGGHSSAGADRAPAPPAPPAPPSPAPPAARPAAARDVVFQASSR